MAAIKGKDTTPEMIVRRYLFSRGLRYRVHVRKLPGNPDIVLPKYKSLIFVDGCFWHGHEGCRYFRMPRSNVEFWRQKINRNVARDIRNEKELKTLGWKVYRVWECEIRKASCREQYLKGLYDKIVRPDSSSGYEIAESEEMSIAADPGAEYGGNVREESESLS